MSLDRQLKLEREMRDGGRAKVLASISNNEEEGRGSANPYNQALLRRYVLPISSAIAADLTTHKAKPGPNKAHAALLQGMDTDTLAFLAVRTVVNTVLEGDWEVPTTRLGVAIGRTVYSELALQQFEHLDPDLYHTMVYNLKAKMSKNERHRMVLFQRAAKENGYELPEWSSNDKVCVGLYLLNHIIESGLLQAFQVRVGKRTVLHASLGVAAKEVVDSITEWVGSITPNNLPCVYPPQDWTSVTEGGFHGDMKKVVPRAIKAAGRRTELMLELGTDLSVVLQMLNYHQSLAWQVNTFILDATRQVMNREGYETEEILSANGPPVPEPPPFLDGLRKEDVLSLEQQEQFVQWKRLKRDWYSEMKLRGTRWGRLSNTMRVAERYRDEQAIHFVYQVDSRGRMYPISSGISPQGSDLSKAMLRSAQGFPVPDGDAFNWFRMHGASTYGIDKVAPADRIKWVQQNSDAIKACGMNPAGNHEFQFWSAADKPMQFLAWCDEYYRRSLDPKNFKSHLTCSMDGSCNGLQNFSALLRDSVGGASVNLLPSTTGLPNDIYKAVAEVTTSLVLRDLEIDTSGFAQKWLQAGITRSLVKRSVMTLPYGSTRYSCADFINVDSLRKGYTDVFERSEYNAAAQWLSIRVWEAIGKVVIKAVEAMTYLQKCAREVVKSKDYITWVTPTGFRVVQMYYKRAAHRIRTRLLGSCVIQLKLDTEEPDPALHKNGVAPNFIHSMDAAHMALVTVASANAGIPFLAMVHDDFGAPFCYAETLFRVIREQFVQLHCTGDPLAEFKAENNLELAPPARGI